MHVAILPRKLHRVTRYADNRILTSLEGSGEGGGQEGGTGKPVDLICKSLKPDNPFTKMAKRSAPKMYTALESVKQGAGFENLNALTREKLLKITALEKIKDDGAVNCTRQATSFDATTAGGPKKSAA